MRTIRQILNSERLFLGLVLLMPSAALLSVNAHLYTLGQIGWTTALILGSSILAGLLIPAVVRIALSLFVAVVPALSGLQARLARSLIVGIGTGAGLVLLFSPINALLGDLFYVVVCYCVLTAAALVLGMFASVRGPNLVLAVLLCFNTGVAVVRHFVAPAPAVHSVAAQPVVFTRTPNVYLVVLESYNSLEVRRDLYGIDNSAFETMLRREQFTVYPGTYANYFASLFSISSTMLMGHHYYNDYLGIADGGTYRKIIGGVLPNPVLNQLSHNGYHIDYSQFDPFLYHAGPLLGAYRAQPTLQPLELFRGLAWLSRYLPKSVLGIAQMIDWRDPAAGPVGVVPADASMPARTQGVPASPRFVAIYTGAVHSPIDINSYPPEVLRRPGFRSLALWAANADQGFWRSQYKAAVEKSDATVAQLVSQIRAEDPSAIVILLGDHGAWLNRNRWRGTTTDVNANMAANGISPPEITRDLFEVFMAVHWPGAPPPGRFSPVNLFRKVFEFLSDQALSTDPARDDSYAFVRYANSLTLTPRLYLTVKDGQPLERWELQEQK